MDEEFLPHKQWARWTETEVQELIRRSTAGESWEEIANVSMH